MAAFGEKAFMLLQTGGKTVGVAGWQVENELTLEVFGECPPPDMALFQLELALVPVAARRPGVRGAAA
mgnify:CR=1 FL=1